MRLVIALGLLEVGLGTVPLLIRLVALRSADFRLALRLRVASAWRARFLACAVLAIEKSWFSGVTKKDRA